MAVIFLGSSDNNLYILKDGRLWQREKDLSNPPDISMCDCCIPRGIEFGDELRVLRDKLGSNDGKNPPSEDDWADILVRYQKLS